jgi:hypothetical protein
VSVTKVGEKFDRVPFVIAVAMFLVWRSSVERLVGRSGGQSSELSEHHLVERPLATGAT